MDSLRGLVVTKRNTAQWLDDQGDEQVPELLRGVADALQALSNTPGSHSARQTQVIHYSMQDEESALRGEAWKLPGDGLYLLADSGQVVYTLKGRFVILEYAKYGTDLTTTAFFNLAVQRVKCWGDSHKRANAQSAA